MIFLKNLRGIHLPKSAFFEICKQFANKRHLIICQSNLKTFKGKVKELIAVKINYFKKIPVKYR